MTDSKRVKIKGIKPEEKNMFTTFPENFHDAKVNIPTNAQMNCIYAREVHQAVNNMRANNQKYGITTRERLQAKLARKN